jgi:hypothetical protein
VNAPRASKSGFRKQGGSALIVALFLIVVVAAFGVFALRIGVNQQQTANLGLLASRAAAAAFSGLEYGANRAFHNQCAALTLLPVRIDDFTVTVVCSGPTNHAIGPGTYQVYDLSSTAVHGVYGTPDFVQRTRQRRVTNIPPGPGVWRD